MIFDFFLDFLDVLDFFGIFRIFSLLLFLDTPKKLDSFFWISGFYMRFLVYISDFHFLLKFSIHFSRVIGLFSIFFLEFLGCFLDFLDYLDFWGFIGFFWTLMFFIEFFGFLAELFKEFFSRIIGLDSGSWDLLFYFSEFSDLFQEFYLFLFRIS